MIGRTSTQPKRAPGILAAIAAAAALSTFRHGNRPPHFVNSERCERARQYLFRAMGGAGGARLPGMGEGFSGGLLYRRFSTAPARKASTPIQVVALSS